MDCARLQRTALCPSGLVGTDGFDDIHQSGTVYAQKLHSDPALTTPRFLKVLGVRNAWDLPSTFRNSKSLHKMCIESIPSLRGQTSKLGNSAMEDSCIVSFAKQCGRYYPSEEQKLAQLGRKMELSHGPSLNSSWHRYMSKAKPVRKQVLEQL